MAEVRFAVLGPLTVTVGADAVPIPGRRERAVLATLLAASGEPVAPERLVDEVWGAGAGAGALNSLQVAISRLRALLQPDRPARQASTLLTTSARGYALVVGAEAVDADRFAALAGAAATALAARDAARAAMLAEEAEAVWTGPAYADVGGGAGAGAGAGAGDVVAAEVARLDDLRLSNLEVLAEARLALGRASEVVPSLEPLLARHPFRERLWQLSALALYHCDRQGDALELLRRLRALLADELGVDPSPATRELEAAILRQDASVTTAAVPPPPAWLPAEPDAGRPPLVGRDAEFAQLRAVLAEAAAGDVRFALVEGEPGIGKTRLFEEVAAFATAAGARVVWGRCAEGDLTPAYWPWLQVVRALAAADRASVPGAAALLDTRSGSAEITDERRFALFESIAELLSAAARTTPLVLVLEDLHWGDPASTEVLAHLAARLHDAPVAVLASRREPALGADDPLSAALAAVSRRPGTRRLVLHGLAPAAAGSLVSSVLHHPVPADVAAAVHRRAEGNPFFVAELSRLLDTEAGLADAAAVERAGIPAGVRDVVRRRLAGLPAETRSVLAVAAVIGRESDLDLVVAASDLSPDACLDALEPALLSRVLVPVPDVPGRHRFAHALVREVTLTEVSSVRGGRISARVAEALLATGDDDDAEAAARHLWAASGVVDPAVAARALEDAAVRALRRTAYESADDLLDRALSLWRGARQRSPETDLAELTATLRLARLRRARRGYGATVASVPLDRADELARRTGRLDLLIGLLHMRWGALTTSCDVPGAVALATEMRELAEISPDPLVQLIGRTAWGVECWQLGRLDEAADTMAGVLELQESFGPVDRVRLAEYGPSLTAPWAVFVLELAGRVRDGEARFEQLSADFPDPYARLVVAEFSALIGFCTGDADRAGRWSARGLGEDRGRGFTFLGAACQVLRGWATATTGDAAAGLELLEAGRERFIATGARTTLGLIAAMRADALLAAGVPPARVRAVLEEDAAEVLASGELACLPYLDAARARVAGALGGVRETVDREA